jgi:hypothetical protein
VISLSHVVNVRPNPPLHPTKGATVLPRPHAALPFAGERPSVRLVPIFPEADGTTGTCG